MTSGENADSWEVGETGSKEKRTWGEFFRQNGIRIAVALVLIAGIIVAIVFRRQVLRGLNDFLEWVRRQPVAGAFAYIGVYFIATIFIIPGLILTVGAGFVFTSALGSSGVGIAVATIVVFIGASLGAIASFVLGRTVLRSVVEGWLKKYPTFKAIDTVLEEQGFKLVALLRLSPLIPFNIFNYVMGLTAVRFVSYSLANIGLLPGTIAYVAVGSSLQNVASVASGASGNRGILIFTIVGTVIAFAIALYVSYLARKKIKAILEKENSGKSLQLGGGTDDSLLTGESTAKFM